jgi:hypothetical protein
VIDFIALLDGMAAWSVGANETAGATAELVKIDGCTLVFQIEAHVEKEPRSGAARTSASSSMSRASTSASRRSWALSACRRKGRDARLELAVLVSERVERVREAGHLELIESHSIQAAE